MQRVLFWLAIGMLGTAVPAAAEGLRISNCMLTNRQIKDADTGLTYGVAPCGTTVLGCTTCKIGTETWDYNRTFVKYGIIPTSDLEAIVRTKNEPEQEWRWEWPQECECNIDSMRW